MLIFVLLSLMDLVLSISLLSHFGEEAELNVIAAWFFVNYGLVGFALFKIGLVSGIVVLVENIKKHNQLYATLLYTLGQIVTGLAVLLGLLAHAYT